MEKIYVQLTGRYVAFPNQRSKIQRAEHPVLDSHINPGVATQPCRKVEHGETNTHRQKQNKRGKKSGEKRRNKKVGRTERSEESQKIEARGSKQSDERETESSVEGEVRIR